MHKPQSIDISSLKEEQIFSIEVQYQEGKKHMKYFNDTMKNFKFPERRMKTNDTIYYETNMPEWERVLKQLKKI